MNLQQARIILRPRKTAETFDLGLRWTARVGGRLYLKLWGVLLLPATLVCFGLRAVAQWPWPSVWLLASGLAMLLQGAFTIAASRLMFEPEVTVGDVLTQCVRRLGAYLLGLVATRVVVALGLLVVLGFPWTWAYGAFVHEAVLLEGHGGFAGTQRSGKFASGQYSAVLWLGAGLLVALGLFVVAADQVGGVMLEFVLQLGRPFGSLSEDGGSAGALLGFFAAVPYLASVRFLHYIDARTRRDGWDLQFAFLSLVMADRAPGTRAPRSAEKGP
ncbi:MAG: hypothetical protein ACE37F_37355 [Nannocystaceae bacterium]|nr:hypothetical protein [bacterium]